MVFLAITGFIALFGGLMWLSSHMKEKRRLELSTWAASKGWSFSAAEDSSFCRLYPAFSSLRDGDNQYAYNIARGAWKKYEAMTFDYHYETESTDSKGNKSTSHHYFSAVIVKTPVPFRPLFIRQENFFDKIGAAIGLPDINFESAEFSRKFCVKSPDKKWAYDVIHTRTMEYLLEKNPSSAIEFDTAQGLVKNNSTSSPQELEASLNLVTGILDLLPPYLIEQQQQQVKP